jgi:hypothetical protein
MFVFYIQLPEPTEPIVSPSGEPSSSEKIRKELQRRNSRPTVERASPKHRLRRQSTVLDEFGTKRRGSKYVSFYDIYPCCI